MRARALVPLLLAVFGVVTVPSGCSGAASPPTPAAAAGAPGARAAASPGPGAATPAPGGSDRAIELRWAFAAGSRRQYALVHDVVTESTATGAAARTREREFHLEADETDRVVGSEEGATRIQVVFDVRRVRAAELGRVDLDYDAARPEARAREEADPVLIFLAGFRINPLRCTIDPYGTVRKKEGVGLRPPQGAEEGDLAQYLEESRLVFPPGTTRKGTRWLHEFGGVVPGVGPVRVARTFAVEGSEARGGRRVARLVFEDVYRLAAGEAAVAGGPQLAGRGTVAFLLDDGCPLESTQEMTVTEIETGAEGKTTRETRRTWTKALRE